MPKRQNSNISLFMHFIEKLSTCSYEDLFIVESSETRERALCLYCASGILIILKRIKAQLH